jgi:hypothetical protein
VSTINGVLLSSQFAPGVCCECEQVAKNNQRQYLQVQQGLHQETDGAHVGGARCGSTMVLAMPALCNHLVLPV